MGIGGVSSDGGLVGNGGSANFTAHTTVTFEDDGVGSRINVRQINDIHDEIFAAAVQGAPEGWRTTLDKLELEVARIQASQPRSVVHSTFTLQRPYHASPSQVFQPYRTGQPSPAGSSVATRRLFSSATWMSDPADAND